MLKFEIFLTVFNITALVYLLHGNEPIEAGRFLDLTIIIRNLRIFTLLREIKSLKAIMETLTSIILPFGSLILVLFTIFYVFAFLGE
jgi:hypothetical protein